MSRFGHIEKTKFVNKRVEETVQVKSWRAKLAERLLSKDIQYLEDIVKERLEDAHDNKVREEADSLVRKWWHNYKYELDDEILEIFSEYEPFLSLSNYKRGESLVDVSEPTPYKQIRINGQWVAFMPRFKKRPTSPTKEEQ